MRIGIDISTFQSLNVATVPAFTPASISGLQLWLDASDASTLFTDSAGTTAATADGDPVGCWKDKSGNAKNATQPNGTKKPLLKINAKNSKNTIRYDGVDDGMINAVGLTSGTYSGVIHVFFAASKPTSGGTYFVERQTGPCKAFFFWQTGPYIESDGSTYAKTMTSGSYSLFNSAGSVVSHITSGTSGSVARVNRSSVTFSSNQYASVSGSSGYILAEREGGQGQRWPGDYFELLVYTKTLTNDEIQNVENYLIDKWGIV